MLELMGYMAIALTVCGQVAINISPLAGQVLWLIANILYLVKAWRQELGKAEMTRNVVMTALTVGLIFAILAGAF